MWWRRFLFPEWALHLNELTPELMTKLPPTDDRLRPDMRLMEHGYYLAVSHAEELWEMYFRSFRFQSVSLSTSSLFMYSSTCDLTTESQLQGSRVWSSVASE